MAYSPAKDQAKNVELVVELRTGFNSLRLMVLMAVMFFSLAFLLRSFMTESPTIGRWIESPTRE